MHKRLCDGVMANSKTVSDAVNAGIKIKFFLVNKYGCDIDTLKVEQHERKSKIFAKEGLDNVTFAMCKHQQPCLRCRFGGQGFGLDVQFSALVCNFKNIFSIGHLYRSGRSMNLPDGRQDPCLHKCSNLVRHAKKP